METIKRQSDHKNKMMVGIINVNPTLLSSIVDVDVAWGLC